MTKIQKAKELIKEQGKEQALAYFQGQLDEFMKTYNRCDFAQVCQKSGLETAVKFIKEYKDED